MPTVIREMRRQFAREAVTASSRETCEWQPTDPPAPTEDALICQLSFQNFGCLPRSLGSSCEQRRRLLFEIGWLSPLALACWPRPFRNLLWRDPRASFWHLPGQHRQPPSSSFPGAFLLADERGAANPRKR